MLFLLTFPVLYLTRYRVNIIITNKSNITNTKHIDNSIDFTLWMWYTSTKGGTYHMTDSEKLDLILSELQEMKKDIDDIKQKTTKIDLTIENELRTNIMRVAEGHLDLSRNLHDAMKPNNEVEMLGIKVRMLETDVRELKQKIS